VTDDQQDFVPIEPTPVVPQPAPQAGSVPPPPPGYYNPTPPPPPAYNPGQFPAQPGPVYASYQPAMYPNGQYATYAPPAPPSGLAITSMILGIVGVLFSFAYGLGLFPAIAAVITGHLAKKRQPHAKGMWLAGLITGYVAIGISLLFIAGAVIFFIYIAATASQYSDY
jgi:hypothetical protein